LINWLHFASFPLFIVLPLTLLQVVGVGINRHIRH
jgi:hypothetical protein